MVRPFLPLGCLFKSVTDVDDTCRWEAFDPVRNYPDLGPVFSKINAHRYVNDPDWVETVELDDTRDLSWATVTKRTLEGWVRGERPNLYGEWFVQ